jgi:hypothetical protein
MGQQSFAGFYRDAAVTRVWGVVWAMCHFRRSYILVNSLPLIFFCTIQLSSLTLPQNLL